MKTKVHKLVDESTLTLMRDLKDRLPDKNRQVRKRLRVRSKKKV